MATVSRVCAWTFQRCSPTAVHFVFLRARIFGTGVHPPFRHVCDARRPTSASLPRVMDERVRSRWAWWPAVREPWRIEHALFTRTHARTHAYTRPRAWHGTRFIYTARRWRVRPVRVLPLCFVAFPETLYIYPGTCKFKFGAILTKMTILSRSWGNRVWRQKVFHVVKFSLTTCQRVDSMTENFVSKKKLS